MLSDWNTHCDILGDRGTPDDELSTTGELVLEPMV